jgi:hypothetical protein
LREPRRQSTLSADKVAQISDALKEAKAGSVKLLAHE